MSAVPQGPAATHLSFQLSQIWKLELNAACHLFSFGNKKYIYTLLVLSYAGQAFIVGTVFPIPRPALSSPRCFSHRLNCPLESLRPR